MGAKLFVLNNSNGYVYRFEIYTGPQNTDTVLPSTPNLGTAANIIIRLS